MCQRHCVQASASHMKEKFKRQHAAPKRQRSPFSGLPQALNSHYKINLAVTSPWDV